MAIDSMLLWAVFSILALILLCLYCAFIRGFTWYDHF